MNRPHTSLASRQSGLAAACAALQPGFARFVLPLLLTCAALLLLDCSVLRDYLARGPHMLTQISAAAASVSPWAPGDLEIQTADPVASAKTLASLVGFLTFMTATSVFLFDAALRVGAAYHRRNASRSLGPRSLR